MVSKADACPDPTVYPVDDEMGEHELQTYMRELLRPLLARFLAERGIRAHVGSDQFIYWVQYRPSSCVAPDLYVLPGVPQEIAIPCWKVWENGGIVPSFALELASRDIRKDYVDAPRRYEALGVDELVIFDPAAGRRRVEWQVLRRVNDELHIVERTNADRVWSRALGCWLRKVGSGDTVRIRIGIGPGGEELYPTVEDLAERERAELLGRVAELEAELAKRQG